MKKLLFLILLMPLGVLAQTGTAPVTVTFRRMDPQVNSRDSLGYNFSGVVKPGGTSYFLNSEYLRLFFLRKADSINNNGYGTRSYINSLNVSAKAKIDSLNTALHTLAQVFAGSITAPVYNSGTGYYVSNGSGSGSLEPQAVTVTNSSGDLSAYRATYWGYKDPVSNFEMHLFPKDPTVTLTHNTNLYLPRSVISDTLATKTMLSAATAETDSIINLKSDKIIDVFIFGGQSNSQAFTNDYVRAIQPDTINYTVKMYDPSTSTVKNLKEPIGGGTGGAYGAFADEYARLTGHSVLIVPTGEGGSALTDSAATYLSTTSWGPGGTLRARAVTRALDARSKAEALGYKVVFKSVIWSQGESDGGAFINNHLSPSTYYSALFGLTSYLRSNIDSRLKFNFILTGTRQFVATDSLGLRYARQKQILYTLNDSLSNIDYYGTKFFSVRGLMREGNTNDVHYGQYAQNEIGIIAAQNEVKPLPKYGWRNSWQYMWTGDSTKSVLIGISPEDQETQLPAKLVIKSNGNTAATYGILTRNSNNTPTFQVNDAGGGLLTSLTVSGLANNTIPYSVSGALTTGSSVLSFNPTNYHFGIGIDGTTNANSFYIKDPGGQSSMSLETNSSTAAGTTSNLSFFRARGVPGTPTAVLSSDRLGKIGASGYNGTNYTTGGAAVNFYATENNTSTATGGEIRFSTTLNGTTSQVDRMVVANNGRVGINVSTPSSILNVGGSNSVSAYTTNGAVLRINSLTITDTTSSAGTIAAQYANSILSPSMASTNAVTVTKAGTLFIAAPTASANTTFTKFYSVVTGAPISLPASTTSMASLNIPNGSAAPTSPITGDIWGLSNALHYYNGADQTIAFLASPSFTTPTLGVASATSINKVAITAPATSATLTIANGKTLTYNNSITIAGTDATTMTFPSTSASIARTDAANTFTGTQSFSSNPVFNTTSVVGQVWTATNTAGAGNWATPSVVNRSHTIFTPTTGGTVNLVANQINIINPAGTLVALTVNLPSSPANNDIVYIKYTQAITTVTYGNGTVVDGITAPAAGGLVVLTYDSGTTSWY